MASSVDDSTEKTAIAKAAPTGFETSSPETLPAYSQKLPSGGPSSSSKTSQAGDPTISNLLSHTRTTAIKGSYVIDPSLAVPPGFLTPLEVINGTPLAYRPSLTLNSTTGSIDIDVTLCGEAGMAVPLDQLADLTRTKLWLRALQKSMTVRLRTSSAGTPRPFRLGAACHRNMNIDIPHTFRGLVNFSPLKKGSSSSISFSKALQSRLSTLSDGAEGLQRYFIGDIGDWKGAAWDGDELFLALSYGTVKLRIVDEEQFLAGLEKEDGNVKKRGLFGWWSVG